MLVGIIGFNCIRGKIDMATHKKCMLADAPCGYSPTLLEIMVRPTVERERQGVQFSPSSIAGCHRQHALQADHSWFLDPDKAYSSTRGTLVHFQMRDEPAPEGTLGVVRELRMHAPIQTKHGEQKFSGQVDEILLLGIETKAQHVTTEWQSVGSLPIVVAGAAKTTLHVSITDWKTKSDIPHSMLEADRRHVYQINEYAWLVTQVLGDYLNNWTTKAPAEARLHLNGDPLPHIDEVMVVGMSVQYMSMSKARRFETGKLLYAKGKMRMEKGTDEKMHRVIPEEHDTLELVPLHEFALPYTESLIRKGIEDQLAGKESLAAPLEGEDAALMCPSCGVKDICITLGKAQGYNMEYQEGKRKWSQSSSPSDI